jgi:cytidine deaminase
MKTAARPVTPRPTLRQRQALLAAARAAVRQAHCPYSHFPVGAALLAADGRVFTGANVENASYGLTICAERVALLQAVHAGARSFLALALSAGDRTPATPCGACRQTLAEFCDDALRIWCTTLTGTSLQQTTLGALLPHAFRLSSLTKHKLIRR